VSREFDKCVKPRAANRFGSRVRPTVMASVTIVQRTRRMACFEVLWIFPKQLSRREMRGIVLHRPNSVHFLKQSRLDCAESCIQVNDHSRDEHLLFASDGLVDYICCWVEDTRVIGEEFPDFMPIYRDIEKTSNGCKPPRCEERFLPSVMSLLRV
jgi:hypothetical protein